MFKVTTANAGKYFRDTVEMSQDAILKTILNTSISPCNAHAKDVRYHKSCWRRNVFHVLRDAQNKNKTSKEHSLQTASLIELINLIDVQTQNQAYLSMDDIETTYANVIGAEGMQNHTPAFSRQWLKEKILAQIPNVKSVLQKNRRKPAVLYSPSACGEDLVNSAITSDGDDMDSMKAIFQAAQVIRKTIAGYTKKERQKNTMPVTTNTDDIPAELYSMTRWIMVGPVDELETETRTSVVDRLVLTVSQNIMYGFKSNRQVKYKLSRDSSKCKLQHERENPQVLGLALTVHHKTRYKMLMGLLNAHGYCVSHSRTLLIETALANAVVENTKRFQGLYVPPFIKKGSFIYFAADNTDFAEDTPDGKGTLHGTIIAVYQKADAPGEPIAGPLVIGDAQ